MEEDENEEESEDSEEDDEKESCYYCDSCNKRWNKGDNGYVLFDDCDDESRYTVILCKKCIDKAYPRETRIIKEPVLMMDDKPEKNKQSLKDYEKELNGY